MRVRNFYQLREFDPRRREKGEASVSKRRIVFLLLASFAGIGWIHLIFVSDWLSVREIRAESLKQLEQADVAREVFVLLDERGGWRPWPARHAWFIDRQGLKQKLQHQLFAEFVSVDKINNNVLRLKIEERSKRFILHSHQQYVWVDLNGIITTELTFDERRDAQSRLLGHRVSRLDDAPVIHVDQDQILHVGENVAFGDDVRWWIQSAKQIMKEGFFYREMIPPERPSSTTATFVAQEGYGVLIDLHDPLAPQVRSYLAFLQSHRMKTKVAEYVDIRIPGKVYVK